jgi:hypothetical protein
MDLRVRETRAQAQRPYAIVTRDIWHHAQPRAPGARRAGKSAGKSAGSGRRSAGHTMRARASSLRSGARSHSLVPWSASGQPISSASRRPGIASISSLA